MRECVLDASVVLEWFVQDADAADPSARLRREFEQGDVDVIAPSLIHLEILNVAGRRWGWNAQALLDLAEALDDLSFSVAEPELADVARWLVAGLTAYDAAYVALAESHRIPLVTRDASILSAALGIAEEPA